MTRREPDAYHSMTYGLGANMKVAQIIAGCLAVIALLVFLFTSNVRVAVSEVALYASGFDKYHASENTGIARAELVRAAEELIQYFNSSEEPVRIEVLRVGQKIELFTQREVLHLADVKDLIKRVYSWQAVALGYLAFFVVLCWLWWRKLWLKGLAKWLLWGSGITIAVLIVFGLASLVNFEAVFTQFHLISFVNDLWQLPADVYLIRLFPEGFWFDAAMYIAGATALEVIIIGGLSFLWLRRTRNQPGV